MTRPITRIATSNALPGDSDLALPDGRRVRLRIHGAAGGRPVIALHGTPGSRLKFDHAHEAALHLGIRIIAPDRWAYGGTDAPRKPELGAYGNDLAAIADALGIERFGLLAVSGGGPFAATAAAHLGVRLTAVALVCPVGPVAGCPIPATSAFHQISFRLLPRLPGVNRAIFGAFRAALRWAPAAAIGTTLARAPPTDREIMSDSANRRALLETFQAGLERSVQGPVIDMAIFSRRWQPAVPLGAAKIWIGGADGNVPIPAARHLAALMGAKIVERPGDGHYWLARSWIEVLGWLREHA